MNCKAVEASLSAFVDREVGPDEMAHIRAHLMVCDACRSEERDLRCLKALLSDIPAPDPTPDFEARLMATIHRPRRPRPVLNLGAPAFLFVCIAVVSLLVTLQYISLGGQKSPKVDIASSDVSADVQRDQAYEQGGTDPQFGALVVTSAGYER